MKKFSLLLALFIGFVACSKENGGPSAGIVTEENSVAQTWMPEVAVDSVEHQLKEYGDDVIEGKISWYDYKLSTVGNVTYEYWETSINACVVQVFEEQNGLNYALINDEKDVDYSQILSSKFGKNFVTETLYIVYTNDGLYKYDEDLSSFTDHCLNAGSSAEILLKKKCRLILRCSYSTDTNMTAKEYLYNNAMALKPYCEF